MSIHVSNQTASASLPPSVRTLWPHQQDGLARVEQYLSRPQTETRAHAALVRMPTGTGKGGIIAGVARASRDIRCVLVVTPSAALRDQIVDEVARIPWGEQVGQLNAPQTWDPVEAVAVVGSTFRAALPPLSSDGRRRLIALTTSALVDIAGNDPGLYTALRTATDVLIFDEGHREPAPQWAAAIRGLDAPVILFTATPCRNDHELFRVVGDHTYVWAYQNAVRLGLVRDVQFQRYSFGTDPEDFSSAFFGLLMSDARGFAAAVTNGLGSLNPSHFRNAPRDRAIVRCASFAAVDAVAECFHVLGVPTLALHEQYRQVARPWGSSDVPPRDARGDALVWVAEDKLIEGIDDPSFRFLGLFEGFSDSRALVQQIGRVTRRPAADTATTALVLIDTAANEQDRWSEYLQYESKADVVPPVFGARDLAKAIARGVPEALYLDRRYRTPFDFDAIDAHAALNYPAHATVGRVGPNFERAKCRDAVAEELRREGAEVRVLNRDADDADVLLYVVARTARVVRTGFWPETDMHALTLIRRGQYLFCTDTGRHSPEALRALTSRISRAELERLLATHQHRIEEVTLAHTRPGPGAIRRHAMRMDSLDDIAGDVSDPLHTCRNASAVLQSTPNGRRRRRYVGFTTDRISETSRADMSYQEYVEWVSEAAVTLQGGGPRPRSLSRYALDVDPVQLDPIGLDLASADLARHYATPAGVALELETTSSVLKAGRCQLTVRLDGTRQSFPCRVRWRQNARNGQGAYLIEAPDLDAAFIARSASDAVGHTVSEFLTAEQRFTLYFADGTLVYADGAYHRADRLARGADGFWLGNHLEPVPGLDMPIPEKGPVVTFKGRLTWDEDSIFGWIDRLGEAGPDPTKSALRVRLASATLLVCDDIGDESSDFIVADSGARWVALIHAKERKARSKSVKPGIVTSAARRLSASSLETVCGQAEKNLHNFVDDAKALASRAKGWDTPWPDAKHPAIPRVRFGASSASDAYSIIRDLLRAPDARREVWIVMSGAFSVAELRSRRLDVRRRPWVEKIETQLQSTAAAVRGAGAQFRFFCAP